MNNELYRVLTHPSLGLDNWNLDAVMKFARIINNIIEIQRKIDSHGLTKLTTSKYGTHYKECAWSRDDVTCGPDSCVCNYIDWNRNNITHLLNEIASVLKPLESRTRSTD
jgi:hypothetical protein